MIALQDWIISTWSEGIRDRVTLNVWEWAAQNLAFTAKQGNITGFYDPHLTPYGIIMKIERNPVPEITEDMVRRDHEYWSQYSERFIGNWITYETPAREVCDWALKTYLQRDLTGFKGDPAFVRDDNAQKAFSKLRNAIG